MNICGLGLRDHIRLLAPLFGLIAIVWALRWGLDAAGAAHSMVRIFSVTGATSLAILIAVWMFHTRGFGSYPNVVVASLLLAVWEQLILIVAIVFSVMTRMDNVFTEPEFSLPGEDPHHLGHILG